MPSNPSAVAAPLAPAADAAPASRKVRSLSGLAPFLRPYRRQIALAAVFLVMAALSTLVLPIALKSLIDSGLVAADPGERVMALRGHFFALFGVGAALGLFSAARFYMVTWLGERVTADLRNAVYAHVLKQSPEFFETTQTGEVLSRLTTDTTLVQTVVGSSLSMGLRNTVMGIGAMAMLIVTNPYVMSQVLGTLVLGAGKAGGAMAAAVDAAWPAGAPLSGLVVTRYDHVPPAYRAAPKGLKNAPVVLVVARSMRRSSAKRCWPAHATVPSTMPLRKQRTSMGRPR